MDGRGAHGRGRAKGRARGRNTGWEAPREGCRAGVCGCAGVRGEIARTAGVGRGELGANVGMAHFWRVDEARVEVLVNRSCGSMTGVINLKTSVSYMYSRSRVPPRAPSFLLISRSSTGCRASCCRLATLCPPPLCHYCNTLVRIP